MSDDTIVTATEKIVAWAESWPDGTLKILLGRNPEANIKNYDYFVGCEIKIIPSKPQSLGITIWICDGAIGFTLDDFGKAADLISVRVAKHQSSLACAGTEPVESIDTFTMIDICKALSNAELEIIAGTVFGKLKSIHTTIKLENDGTLDFTNGLSLRLIKFWSALCIADVVPIQLEAW